MRRNNLARNLERFELQRVIAEDDRLYKIDIEENKITELEKRQVEWMTQKQATIRAALNPDPNSPVTYYDRELSFLEQHKAKILPLAALGLLLAGVLGAMS